MPSNVLFCTEIFIAIFVIDAFRANAYTASSTQDIADFIEDVSYSASIALDNAPEIGDIAGIEQTKALTEIETTFKAELLNKLLDDLVELHARINVMIAKGRRLVAKLKEMAEKLFKRIVSLGGEDMVNSQDFKDRVLRRTLELMNEAYSNFCCNSGWQQGVSFVQHHFRNASAHIQPDSVRYRLISKVNNDLHLVLLQFEGGNKYRSYAENKFRRMVHRWLEQTVNTLMDQIHLPLILLQEAIEQTISNEAKLVHDAMRKSVNTIEDSFDLFLDHEAVFHDHQRPPPPEVYNSPTVCGYLFKLKEIFYETQSCNAPF